MVKAIRPAMSSATGTHRTHQNGGLICAVGEISISIKLLVGSVAYVFA
jgi:hypothetical protein